MRSLRVKLALAFLLVVVLAVGMVALLANRATRREFETYIRYGLAGPSAEIVAALARFYAAQGSWQGVDAYLPGIVSGGRGQGQGMGMGAASFAYIVADADGAVVASTETGEPGRRLSRAELRRGVAITVGGHQVGTLLVQGEAGRSLGMREQRFLDDVNRALVMGGVLTAALAAALGLWLAGRLTSPLRRLGEAARCIAAGNLSCRVEIGGQDEIGVLGRTFNQMAESLQRAETARRQMISDIAHELRTPLTIIRGHLEALKDGVFPSTPENLDIMYDEAILLERLVRDLQELALAEAGQLSLDRQPEDPAALLAATVRRFQPQAAEKGLRLELELPDALPLIPMDVQRVGQVLGNLIANAIRHTPSGGAIRVRAGWISRQSELPSHGALWPSLPTLPFLAVYVSDTGEGIPPEDLPHVFDRFYRADRSRARATGGSGLGLTIAQQLVRAHGGDIGVQSRPGEGTTFAFTLPGTVPTSGTQGVFAN